MEESFQYCSMAETLFFSIIRWKWCVAGNDEEITEKKQLTQQNHPDNFPNIYVCLHNIFSEISNYINRSTFPKQEYRNASLNHWNDMLNSSIWARKKKITLSIRYHSMLHFIKHLLYIDIILYFNPLNIFFFTYIHKTSHLEDKHKFII